MAFSDNPFVSSLMQETGLNNLMSMGGAPPSPAGGAPPASPIGAVQSQGAPHSPQMKPEYQVARPPVNPRFAGPMGGMGAGGSVSPAAQQGVMSADTLNSPTVHDLLGHFGVSAPQGIDDHLFIHNPQAFAKHPIIANMIENGLTGLANYHTGQDTAGTLSNIASSVLNGQAEHQQAYNARAMAPLMQAQAVGNLQDMDAGQKFKQAEAAKNTSMGNYYEGLNAERLAAAQGRDAVNQNKIDTSPAGQMSRLYHATLQNMMPDGDESKATPAQQADAMNRVMTQASVAKSAGAAGVQDQKGKTAVQVANIKANAPSKSQGSARFNPVDSKQYSDLDSQRKQLVNQVNAIDSGKPVSDENGMPLLTPEDRQAHKQVLFNKAKEYTNQMGAIAARYGMTGTPQQSAPQQPGPGRIDYSYDPHSDSMRKH